MAVQILTVVQGRARFRERTHLDGKEYVLEFRLSERESRWYLDISDVNGVLLVGALKLVLHRKLLEPLRSVAGLPPGELLLLDTRPTPAPPDLDELGVVDQLVYVEAGTEVAA
jgi:hypothetical protein